MHIRTLLVAGMLTLASPVGAQSIVESGSSGAWTWARGTSPDGNRICALSSFAGEKSLHVKHIAGTDYLTIHLIKDSWKIPSGTYLKMAMKFGGESPWSTVKAIGEGNTVEWRLRTAGGMTIGQTVLLFMKEMAAASVVRIAFEGAEPTWVFGLNGSANSLGGFSRCITRWTIPTQPNAPQAQGPTQPFKGAPSQPTSTMPTHPGLRI